MPGRPSPLDFFVVVPFHETPPETLDGAANVFIVQTSDADVAAEIAFEQGFVRCIVLEGDMYEEGS